MKGSTQTNPGNKFSILKIQLISSVITGAAFGFYHYLFSTDVIWTFFYYFGFVFLECLLLWQASKYIFEFSEQNFNWITETKARVFFSLLVGLLAAFVIVLFMDLAVPRIAYPLLYLMQESLINQPVINAQFILIDGIISYLILLLFLTFINLVAYFNLVKQQGIREAERNVEIYFETLIGDIQDVIQVIDSSGKIKYCSASIERLTGYTVEETLRAVNGFTLIHHDDREKVEEEFLVNAKRNIESYLVRYRILTRIGDLRYVETRVINSTNNPKLSGFITISSDVTERVLAEQKELHQRNLYRLLTDISKQFLEGDFDETVVDMLRLLGEFCQVDRSYVFIANEEGQHWECLFEWRNDRIDGIKSYHNSGFPMSLSPWLKKQVFANNMIRCQRVSDLPEEAGDLKEICKADSTISLLLIPVYYGNKVYGFMGFDSVVALKHWSDEDVSALRLCSEILVTSLVRKNAETETRNTLSLTRAIVESTSEGILLTDLQDNILFYNDNFKAMWLLPDEVLSQKKKSTALSYAIQHIENATEIHKIISTSELYPAETIRLVAYLKNRRVLEGISKPQVVDGKIVGRVWSNRDITDRVNAEKEEIEKGMAQAQFESLKNQVNPHFLFNSLNVLASLVHIDPGLSEKFIDQLAKSYRYLLEQKDNEIVTLKTEIDFVESFTFLLKIRFEEKLKVNIRLTPEVCNFYIAPLTLQLLIENAVKHNVISTEAPLVIDIYDEEGMYLVVSNNLQLREQQLPSTGVGLKNIINRYKLITPLSASFKISHGRYIAKIPFIKINSYD